jgi:hypothetical protein
MMREQVKKELVRPAATRFGTAYLTLQSMYELKEPLQAMFTSSDWYRSTYGKTSEGKQVRKIVLDEARFWESVAYAIKTTRPLFKVLRMTDSERTPPMGFLYASMDQAKEEIKASLDNELGAYNEIIQIIESKWENQMARPLHAAACMLNPRYNYDTTWQPPLRMRNVIYDAMDRLVPELAEQERVDMQLIEFKAKRGVFGREVAKSTALKHAPGKYTIRSLQ